MWATVSALMCLVCPVLLSAYTVLYVLFHEQINGMEYTPNVRVHYTGYVKEFSRSLADLVVGKRL